MSDKEIVINQTDIAQRVNELGTTITQDYAGAQLLVIGVLKEAVYWILRSSHMFIPGGTPWTIYVFVVFPLGCNF